MFSSDDAIAIFSVLNSESSSLPVGETELIWPAGKPFRLEIPSNRYCPHYFKTFSSGSGMEAPCPRETPICKFSGNGGYSCCDRVKNCPNRACDAAKGEILKSGRWAKKTSIRKENRFLDVFAWTNSSQLLKDANMSHRDEANFDGWQQRRLPPPLLPKTIGIYNLHQIISPFLIR